MEQKQLQFIDLFFNESESFCISPSKYGFHSITKNDILNGNENGHLVLTSPNNKYFHPVDDSCWIMMAINPIKGFKRDDSVTGYRSFLVELDTMPLNEQMRYIEETKLPYSVCVFSGNKSLHYGIVLSEDLANDQEWYLLNEWMLNILTEADQQNKSPSRGIRFPFNKRPDGKQLVQAMIGFKGRTKKNDFINWLNRWPQHKPQPKLHKVGYNENNTVRGIPNWILNQLNEGIHSDRNSTWFRIAAGLSTHVSSEIELITSLEPYFSEDKDFKTSEWETVIKSAYKKASR